MSWLLVKDTEDNTVCFTNLVVRSFCMMDLEDFLRSSLLDEFITDEDGGTDFDLEQGWNMVLLPGCLL